MSDSLVERLRMHAGTASANETEAADEIERLQEEARRWYHADGNSELLSTAEECVKRRIGAALIIANAQEAIETSYDGEPERPLWEKIMAVCSAGHTMARRLVEQEAIIATLPTCNGLRDGKPVDDVPVTPGMAKCHDCGLPYGCPEWADIVVPDDIWERISPTGTPAGLLCFSCMCGRLGRAGLVANVPFQITSGPFAFRVREFNEQLNSTAAAEKARGESNAGL